MKIAILDLTTHPEPLLSGLPRIYEQIMAWIAPALPEAQLVPYDIAQGGQALPAPPDFDGIIISGSEFGVYDDVAWIAPLRDLLIATRDAGKPMYGICFGHQLMADTFGGRAEKSDAGNHLGARRFQDKAGAYDAMVWHQDQVTQVPASARVTASAPYCPVGALAYDFPAMSVQYHPEYHEDHLRRVYDLFRGGFVSEEKRTEALASFETANVAIDLQAAEAAAFFRGHIGT